MINDLLRRTSCESGELMLPLHFSHICPVIFYVWCVWNVLHLEVERRLAG